LKIIRDLAGNSKTVLVCGGTGMYFRSLSEGLGVQVDSDPGLRDELMERGRKEGSAALHAELMEKDPETALKLHPNDLQRIVRALIVFYQSGEKIQDMRERRAPEGVELISLRSWLSTGGKCFMTGLTAGLRRWWERDSTNEFLRLWECGYGQNSPGLQCVGYKELFGVERGEYSLDDAVEQIKRNTRRYAKRQITWFTHQTDAIEIPADDAFTSLRKFYRAKMFLDCCD
jgi:tRNA dimethylallyltransferase